MKVNLYVSRLGASRQRGVVLFLAMIVLVAMTLGGLALFRSVDQSIILAGNVALQRSAVRQGDVGAEAAATTIAAKTAGDPTYLENNHHAEGYAASYSLPGTNQTWAEYWDVVTATITPVTLTKDPNTGNQVSYIVHRMCNAAGALSATVCVRVPVACEGEGSRGAGVVELGSVAGSGSQGAYYRVTARIAGPRSTVSFIQTMIAVDPSGSCS